MNAQHFQNLKKDIIEASDIFDENRCYYLSDDELQNYLVVEMGYMVIYDDLESKVITKKELNTLLNSLNEKIEENRIRKSE